MRDARIDVRITVFNQPDLLSLRKVSDYNYPRAVTPVPGTNRIFVAQADGQVYLTDPSTSGRGQLYLTMSNLYPIRYLVGANERPLLNMIPAPDYASSGLIYAMVVSATGDLELRRYGRLASGLGDPASADVILRISGVLPADDSGTDSLGGGMAFGPDGYLYLGIGNVRARGAAPDNLAQDRSSLRGKILRIDLRSDAYPADPNRDYAIPTDNPFRSGTSAPEVYAYGLEDPRRMYFDGTSLLIGDAHPPSQSIVDQPRQEVHLLRPQYAGANFGYPALSGAGVVPPVITTEGTLNGLGLMTGGPVFRGPITQLTGLYFLADAVTGKLWTTPVTSIVQGTTIPEPNLTLRNNANFLPGYSPRTIGFGTDASGNLYVLSDGEIDILELR